MSYVGSCLEGFLTSGYGYTNAPRGVSSGTTYNTSSLYLASSPYLGGVMTSSPEGLQNMYQGVALEMFRAQQARNDGAARAILEQQQAMNDRRALMLDAQLMTAKPRVKCALHDCRNQAQDNPETLCSEHWENLESWRSHGKTA